MTQILSLLNVTVYFFAGDFYTLYFLHFKKQITFIVGTFFQRWNQIQLQILYFWYPNQKLASQIFQAL